MDNPTINGSSRTGPADGQKSKDQLTPSERKTLSTCRTYSASAGNTSEPSQLSTAFSSALTPSSTGMNLESSGPAFPDSSSPRSTTPASNPSSVMPILSPRQMEERHALFLSSGVPQRHRHQKIAELRQHQQWSVTLDATLKILAQGEIVVLLGDRGNGKTQLGVECCRKWAVQGKATIYIRAQEIYDQVRDSYNSKTSEAHAMRRPAKASLLVIDEFQDSKGSDFERRIMTMLIDKRYGEVLPTLLIANMTVAEFASAAGPSIVSRVNEGGSFIVCPWDTFRKGTEEWKSQPSQRPSGHPPVSPS